MILSIRVVDCLRGSFLQYERNEEAQPLVNQLSDKALLGSYAVGDKS